MMRSAQRFCEIFAQHTQIIDRCRSRGVLDVAENRKACRLPCAFRASTITGALIPLPMNAEARHLRNVPYRRNEIIR